MNRILEMLTLSQMLLTLVNVNIKALCVKVHLPYYFMVEKFATSFHLEDFWYGLYLGMVSYYNTMHLNSYHTILLLKSLQYHSTWKINCRVPITYFYRTIPILGGMKPLDQLRINVINEDHSQSIAIRWDHFCSIMINL